MRPWDAKEKGRGSFPWDRSLCHSLFEITLYPSQPLKLLLTLTLHYVITSTSIGSFSLPLPFTFASAPSSLLKLQIPRMIPKVFFRRRRAFALESSQDLNKTCKTTYNCGGNLVCLAQFDPLLNSSSKHCSYPSFPRLCTSPCLIFLSLRHCNNKSDCLSAYGSVYECSQSKELPGRFCLYKSLWPLSWQDGLGVVLLLVGAALAAGGGLGGGGIVVPLLVLLFQFPPRQAVALSNVLPLVTPVFSDS